jgi:hypothetical protein
MFRYNVHHEKVGLRNVSLVLQQVANTQSQEGWELVTFSVSNSGDELVDLFVVFRQPID